MNPQALIFIVLIIGVYYFMLIRPRQQEAKQHQALISQLAEGEEIMTIGGIFGRVVEVGEDRVRVAVADGSELEIAKRAVSRVVPAEADADDDESVDSVEDEAEVTGELVEDVVGDDASDE